MINSDNGWVLAPAYDLLNVSLLLPSDKEELALTMNGKKSNFSRKQFNDFGENLGLSKKQMDQACNRIEKKQEEIERMINSSFLSSEMKEAYLELFLKRKSNLNLK